MADPEPPAPLTDAEDQRRMSFWEHFEELRHRLRTIFIVFVILFVVFMVFSMSSAAVGSVQVPILVPAFAAQQSPVGAQLFEFLLNDLVPKNISGHPVYVTSGNIADGVVVEIETAMFLAVVVGSPAIVYELSAFVGPALKPSEKRLIRRAVIPVVGLFLAGIALCFVVVLPFTYNLMFSYQAAVGVTFFKIDVGDFAAFTLLFLLAFGLAFQLPVVMYALSAVGLVGSAFWKKYWRFAVAGIFIFGALITPDGSGITMMLVSLPMLALYVAGFVASVRVEKRRLARAS